MGILDDLGVGDSIPKIDLTGALSGSWIYIGIIIFLGLIFIIGLALFLFFMTYKKKIVLFENISGQGYQPVLRSRARVIRLGVGGQELLKTLIRRYYVSASGRKMGKNTYWYAKGQDGYWYNIVVGDLDTKKSMLDIDPIDRDVRMFHVALDRLSHSTYGKNSFWDKHTGHVIMFLFLIVLVLGMWFIVGKIGDAVAPLSQATDKSFEIQQMNLEITQRLDSVARSLGLRVEEVNPETTGGSGLVPVG